jgi:hypothetical protein
VIHAPASDSRFFTDEFINFSGWGSFDPDGTVYLYEWNFSGLVRSGMNVSVRLDAGVKNVTLRVTDDRGGQAEANITVRIEVNGPPAVSLAAVAPSVGFAGEPFTFSFVYADPNGEEAASALLLLDEAPHAMLPEAGGDPLSGQRYALTLALSAGRHSFYFLAFDGNLTTISGSVSGPDVFENVTLLSLDGLARFSISGLPPGGFALELESGAVPAGPPLLEAVSGSYRINATAASGTNFTLSVSFTPFGRVNASTALLMRLVNGSWQPLVTSVDAPAHTASVAGEFRDLPATFRVFAGTDAPPVNLPPFPRIEHRAAGEGYYPNATVRFDGTGTTDEENATLLLGWRFVGPGLSTGWIAGPAVEVTFPHAGLYAVELRASDGVNDPVVRASVVEIRERPPPVVDLLEEPIALAALAGAVLAPAVAALWWRGRRPAGKRHYDDQYGRLYKQQAMEEKEYAQLFEKFAVPDGESDVPPLPETDPPAKR